MTPQVRRLRACCSAADGQDQRQNTASRSSERDVVVDVGARTWRPAAAATAAAGGAALRRAFMGRFGVAAGFTAGAAGVEHGEFAAEALQHDLGGVFLLAGLVGPFARLQLALDIDLGALVQVLLRHVHDALVEDDDPMPLGLLAALAGILVAPAFGGGEGEVGHARAVLRAADLGIAAEVADQNDLVDAACHDRSPPPLRNAG